MVCGFARHHLYFPHAAVHVRERICLHRDEEGCGIRKFPPEKVQAADGAVSGDIGHRDNDKASDARDHVGGQSGWHDVLFEDVLSS